MALSILDRSIAEARMAISGERHKFRNMAVDFYQSAQTAEHHYLKKYFGDRTALPYITEDLTRRVIERISMVYKRPPMRSIEDQEDSGIAEFEADYPDYQMMWKEGERYGNLIHNVLLRVEFDVEEDRYNFFIDYDYIPHFGKKNALRPIAYSILLPEDTENKTAKVQNRFLYVSDDEIFIHDEYGHTLDPLEDRINPYGIMPVVDLSRFAVGQYWQEGAKPLIEANRMLNIAQLESFYGLIYQASGQPYAKGMDPETVAALKRSADQLWATNNEDAEFGILQFNPHLVEATEFIERYIQRVLSHYGLSASFKDAGDVMSGIALQIKNMDLLEKRQSDIDHFRHKEMEMYKLLSQMNAVQNTGYNLPGEAAFKVDFSEVDFPTDPAEERAQWEWEIKNNLARPEDYLMAKNPDLSLEEAQKMVIEMRDANNAARSRGGGLFRQLTQQDEEDENEL